jgi:D-inositol-3-phosphate glycosyltransferase
MKLASKSTKEAGEHSTQTLHSQRIVSLLTGGRDKPYALGLASALLETSIAFDFIGSELVDGPELHCNPLVNFLNLRDQNPNVGPAAKVLRTLKYYLRLVGYAARTEARLLHVLWNNKVEWFDRTLLMFYYRLLGKRIVLTVHNVNAGQRDRTDSAWNRLTLRMQYSLADHLFVHSARMKQELLHEFGVTDCKVTVIPFGINNTVPNTGLSRREARQQLGLSRSDKVLLFFGNIARYKGLEYLVRAFEQVAATDSDYRLIIVGSPKRTNDYWLEVKAIIDRSAVPDRITQRITYVPDEDTEIYFKAADVLVLPYKFIFQSGVLFLGYNFGLPAIATDVGSLADEIIEGETGFLCKPGDVEDLAVTIRRYFHSDLFHDLPRHRLLIQQFASDRYSWTKVAKLTTKVYAELLELPFRTTGESNSPDLGKLSHSELV